MSAEGRPDPDRDDMGVVNDIPETQVSENVIVVAGAGVPGKSRRRTLAARESRVGGAGFSEVT